MKRNIYSDATVEYFVTVNVRGFFKVPSELASAILLREGKAVVQGVINFARQQRRRNIDPGFCDTTVWFVSQNTFSNSFLLNQNHSNDSVIL